MQRTILIALAIASAAASGPALAADHAWQVGNGGYHLTFADQNLHTPTGRAVVLSRVEAIAGRLCRNVGVHREELACRDQIVQGASGSLRPIIRQALAERAGRTGVEMAASR